jgi:hypothetical protein
LFGVDLAGTKVLLAWSEPQAWHTAMARRAPPMLPAGRALAALLMLQFPLVAYGWWRFGEGIPGAVGLGCSLLLAMGAGLVRWWRHWPRRVLVWPDHLELESRMLRGHEAHYAPFYSRIPWADVAHAGEEAVTLGERRFRVLTLMMKDGRKLQFGIASGVNAGKLARVLEGLGLARGRAVHAPASSGGS